MGEIIPLAAAQAVNRRLLWTYIKLPITKNAQLGRRGSSVTIWIGPFKTEAQQVLWRGEFESELERHEFKNYDIRNVPTGRCNPTRTFADIAPWTPAEQAVCMIPGLLLKKTTDIAFM